MKALSSVLLALSLLVAPHLTNAQGDTSHRDLEWQLWNNCEPVTLNVDITGNINKKGLSEKQVRDAVETRFISARIYGEAKENPGILGINLRGVGLSFSVTAHFSLPTYRLMYTDQWRHGYASTWVVANQGTSVESKFILDILTEIVDHFVADYLRINYPAC